jgi:Avidin family
MASCSLQGVWVNELHSMMALKQSSDGLLTGCYYTDVGDAVDLYRLTGATNLHVKTLCDDASVGFVVVWNNALHGDSASVTAWSGQYQQLDDKEIITTQWLLTRETVPSDNWSSTQVWTDEFARMTDPVLEAELNNGCFVVGAANHVTEG